ncbi:MAG: PEP-CTERM sorting domain-containing protein [Candidatus Binataceae bacterium]
MRRVPRGFGLVWLLCALTQAVAGPAVALDNDYASVASTVWTTVPEPATLALLGFGMLTLGWALRRRRKSKRTKP